MLNSDFLVIDFEGFRHKSQQLIPKEISDRGANYQDTILLQPPVKFSLLADENKKSYARLTDNLHEIVWEAGSYDHTFIFTLEAPLLLLCKLFYRSESRLLIVFIVIKFMKSFKIYLITLSQQLDYNLVV